MEIECKQNQHAKHISYAFQKVSFLVCEVQVTDGEFGQR